MATYVGAWDPEILSLKMLPESLGNNDVIHTIRGSNRCDSNFGEDEASVGLPCVQITSNLVKAVVLLAESARYSPW